MTNELHYGTLPTHPDLLMQMQRAQELGFRTVLSSEYHRLRAQGIEVETFDLLLEGVSLERVDLRHAA